MKILSTQYLQNTTETKELASLQEIQLPQSEGSILWVDVSEYQTLEDLRPLEQVLKLHPLALEDCFHIRQRPKIEDFKEYVFLISRNVLRKEGQLTEGDQLGIFLGKNYLLTVHKNLMPKLNTLSEEMAQTQAESTQRSYSYLLYTILDMVVDEYEEAVRHVEETEVNIGCDVLKEQPSKNILGLIYANRRSLLLADRLLRNQSHVVNRLAKTDVPIVNPETTPFFGDIHDHTSRTLERIAGLLEMNMGSLNIYTSAVSNKTNEVMKLLTIISTIGVPLTVLVGWYGMNFREMPEIYWAYGYAFFILIAVSLMAVSVFLFKRKGWL